MKLDVTALKEEPGRREQIPLRVELDPAEVSGDLVSFLGPFTGTADAYSTIDSILVHFRLSGEVELRCARCLATFRRPLTLHVTEEFREGTPRGLQGDLEEDLESGVSFVRYTGDAIELDDIIRQQILLELPMKPLCHEGCRGLCPTCGQNLNEGTCQCQPETGDPRLAALEELRRRLDPGT